MDFVSLIKDVATPVLAAIGSTIGLFQIYRGQRERIRAQAELIDAWWVRIDAEKNMPPSIDNEDDFLRAPFLDPERYRVGIVLLNRSQTPIRRLAVYGEAYKMENGKRLTKDDPRILTEENARIPATLLLQEILVPGEFVSFAVYDNEKKSFRPWTYPEELSYIKQKVGKVRPIINDEKWKVDVFIFEDAAGRRWVRRENGKLSRYWFYKVVTKLNARSKMPAHVDDPVNPLNYMNQFKKKNEEFSVYSYLYTK